MKNQHFIDGRKRVWDQNLVENASLEWFFSRCDFGPVFGPFLDHFDEVYHAWGDQIWGSKSGHFDTFSDPKMCRFTNDKPQLSEQKSRIFQVSWPKIGRFTNGKP